MEDISRRQFTQGLLVFMGAMVLPKPILALAEQNPEVGVDLAEGADYTSITVEYPDPVYNLSLTAAIIEATTMKSERDITMRAVRFGGYIRVVPEFGLTHEAPTKEVGTMYMVDDLMLMERPQTAEYIKGEIIGQLESFITKEFPTMTKDRLYTVAYGRVFPQ